MVFLSAGLLIFFGCANPFVGPLSEGIVEFEIQYPPETSNDKVMMAMMPEKLRLIFNPDNTRSDLTVGMGVMEVSFISKNLEKELVTLLSIVDKKYALVMDSAKVGEELKRKIQWKVSPVSGSKRICGYKCKKAMVSNGENIEFPVFYTDELEVKNPNWSSPFHQIPGVLMEYDLVLNNIRMHLSAISVQESEVNPGVFVTPANFPSVKREEMPEIFSQFFD